MTIPPRGPPTVCGPVCMRLTACRNQYEADFIIWNCCWGGGEGEGREGAAVAECFWMLWLIGLSLHYNLITSHHNTLHHITPQRNTPLLPSALHRRMGKIAVVFMSFPDTRRWGGRRGEKEGACTKNLLFFLLSTFPPASLMWQPGREIVATKRKRRRWLMVDGWLVVSGDGDGESR